MTVPALLINPDGTPLAAMMGPANQGASTSAGSIATWRPFSGSADADLLFDRDLLVSRSRDLSRNEGLASGAMTTFVDNVLGSNGLRLQAKVDYAALGWDADKARDWNEKTEAKFRAWAEGPDFECDAAETTDLHGLAVLTFRAVLLNGDHLALPLWLRSPNRQYATAIQLVESDRLSNPYGRGNTPRLRGGVEINKFGAPLAYHIRESHPGDVLMGGGLVRWRRIPAKSRWGRRRVIHVMEPDRTGQRRGRPSMSSILGEFKVMKDYRGAELDAALTNAMVAAILESPMDGVTLSELFGDGENYLNLRDKAPAITLARNSVIRTFPGETLKSFDTARPNDAFGPFMDTLLRVMAAGLNIPYELFLKDFSKTNYSSARAALMEAWRHFMARRAFMAKYFYRPIYALWLEEAVNKGEIEAPDFYANRAAYLRSKWIGDGRGYVDPFKEAKAQEVRMGIGVSTLEKECAEQGDDWEEVLEQRAREQAAAERLGLSLPGMPGQGPVGPDPLIADDEEDNNDKKVTALAARLDAYEKRMADLRSRAGAL